MLNEDKLKLRIIKLELVLLQQHHSCALWNPALHSLKAFSLPDQLQDLVIEIYK